MSELIQSELAEIANKIKGHSQRMRAIGAMALTTARNTGDLLIEAKSKLPHGQFSRWIDEHCEITARYAQISMQISENWSLIADQMRNNFAFDSINEALHYIREQRKLASAEPEPTNPAPEESVSAEAEVEPPDASTAEVPEIEPEYEDVDDTSTFELPRIQIVTEAQFEPEPEVEDVELTTEMIVPVESKPVTVESLMEMAKTLPQVEREILIGSLIRQVMPNQHEYTIAGKDYHAEVKRVVWGLLRDVKAYGGWTGIADANIADWLVAKSGMEYTIRYICQSSSPKDVIECAINEATQDIQYGEYTEGQAAIIADLERRIETAEELVDFLEEAIDPLKEEISSAEDDLEEEREILEQDEPVSVSTAPSGYLPFGGR